MADEKTTSMPIPVWSSQDYSQARKEVEQALKPKGLVATVEKSIPFTEDTDRLKITVQAYASASGEKLFKLTISSIVNEKETKIKTGLVSEALLTGSLFAGSGLGVETTETPNKKSVDVIGDYKKWRGWLGVSPTLEEQRARFEKLVTPEKYVISKLKDSPDLQLQILINKSTVSGLRKLGPISDIPPSSFFDDIPGRGWKRWLDEFEKIEGGIKSLFLNTRTGNEERLETLILQLSKRQEPETKKRIAAV